MTRPAIFPTGWSVPRTQLVADCNQILSVIRLCHRRPTREALQLVEELRAESAATVGQLGDTPEPEPIHP